MVLPAVTYNRNSRFIRRLRPNMPGYYEYENRRVHAGREGRRARTVRVQSLPRSQRPPEERAARTNALRRATTNARRSVYRTLAHMNNSLMRNTNVPAVIPHHVNINLTKTSGNITLSRNVTNAIMANNLGPIVVEVWNTNNGNRHYMNPNTFKKMLKKNGTYISPFTKVAGKYKILKATYTNATQKPNNVKKVMKAGMKLSKKINKNRKKYKELIPSHLVGRPNTSGNTAFARSLA